ncbi:MAG: lipoprotein insertase outer membrane protein LolB [Betaproteobacteria bacterium]|nr:lipoprotein insertase outer membrane protein LolB [Betaproteobacteria bacterium]
MLLVQGCASLQQQTAIKTVFTEPAADIQNIKSDAFNLIGRISIQNEHHRHSGRISWQHSEIDDEISLFSPFGQVVAKILRNRNDARLITSKQEVFYATDIEQLTEDILGWRLPLNGLQYWIQGHHSPVTASAKDINQEDRVIAIRQDNWHIRYNSFFPNQPEQIARPKILELNYQDLKIRMVVDNWEIID